MSRIAACIALGAALLLAPGLAHAQQDAAGDYIGSDAAPDIKAPQRQPQGVFISGILFDKAVAEVFAAADTNHDGMITLDEFNAEIAALRDGAIRDRFAQVDANRDGAVSLDEFTRWQRGLGSAALSDQAKAQGGAYVAEVLPLGLSSKAAKSDVGLLIEPISATLLVAANTNYDTGMSLEEFTAYEDQKFAAADKNADGFIDPIELEKVRNARHGG